MAALLDEIDGSLQEPQTGEIRNGIIVDKRPNEVLIDIGFKSEGVVSGREIERVGKNKYLVVESYRNEEEKANLLYWQLTCESFYRPEAWAWWFQQTGYTGDWSFIYFE